MTDPHYDIFSDATTSLADLKAAGWRRYYSSSGDWCFEKQLPGGGSVRFAPKWVRELRDQSYTSGMKAVRNAVKSALGMEINE
jgi:hypothetical protein